MKIPLVTPGDSSYRSFDMYQALPVRLHEVKTGIRDGVTLIPYTVVKPVEAVGHSVPVEPRLTGESLRRMT